MAENLEIGRSSPSNRMSYAIPLPHIPNEATAQPNKNVTKQKNMGRGEQDVDREFDILLPAADQLTTTSPARITHSVSGVQSRAVVRYAEVLLPAPLARIEENTDLRNPPDNWLRTGKNMKGFVQTPSGVQTGFSSFKMANDFFDCLPNVDVISDGENIKKLLKLPFSNAAVSMIVHRVGKTLLIDDFDIHKYLLRRSATEWEWLRRYFSQTVLQQIHKKEGAVVRKNCSSSAQQERRLVSKFLYRSLQHSPAQLAEDVDSCEVEGAGRVASSLRVAKKSLPPLPDPEIERNIPHCSPSEDDRFDRNFLWTFEDIRMLIGSNMPIFGDDEHPCVSLRLRDMKKPINILTGMDYWLDNLMCQVPEVVMCYHLDGIVQRYELIKTEDLPTLEGSNFSPKIVKNIAQNVLAFLKSNAAKEGHTYWLFKGKNDDIVKLYDLTSLGQKDGGLKPDRTKADAADEVEEEQSHSQEETETENPFQTPVSLLLYRLARSLLESGASKEDSATARALLQNCVSLLNKRKFPHIATSAHFLLSELYVPADTDPARPTFTQPTRPGDAASGHADNGECLATGGDARSGDSPECSDEEEIISLEVNSLCYPYRLKGFREEIAPLISADVEFRCSEALVNINQGLQYLTHLETLNRAKETAYKKERENIERDNLRMSVPNQPIPMGYISLDATEALVARTRSLSCGELQSFNQVSSGASSLPTSQKQLSTTDYLKFLLLKKALLVYVTLAEASYDLERYGRSLRCIKRAINCHSMVESLGGLVETDVTRNLMSFALGVAGDCYMAQVAKWNNAPMYQEQYSADEEGDEGIAAEIEKYTEEKERDWMIKHPRDIQEAMELADSCYCKALEAEFLPDEDRSSLISRHGNVLNELGVFFMNQATALVQKVSTEMDPDQASVSVLTAAQELLSRSLHLLEIGIEKFQKVGDNANIALLMSNTGRLWRIAGHAKGLCRTERREEFAELADYKKALDQYQSALRTLGQRRTNAGVWDSVNWELCSTYFSVGCLLQDQAPLSTLTREEAEKQVTEYLLKSLKYCDTESGGPRQVIYLYRAGVIHQRLASLYHHAYRSYDPSDVSPRRKKLKQLSQLHYTKASALFLSLDRCADFLRSVMESAGLMEANLESQSSSAGKQKQLLNVLETLLETQPGLERLLLEAGSNAEAWKGLAYDPIRPEKSREEREEEASMLETLVQRVQATLLAIYKLQAARTPKKGKEGAESTPPPGLIVKNMYVESLKMEDKSAMSVLALLQQISKQLQHIRAQ